MTKEQQNQYVYERFKRSERAGNVTEMHAAKEDYENNIAEQEKELEKMDKNSAQYRENKEKIEKQQEQARDMKRSCAQKLQYHEHPKKLDELKEENAGLEKKMHSATEKGDSKAYDAARQKYETNIKAQDNLSKSMKINGIPHENTTNTQNIRKQHLDNDMADSYKKKMDERTEKGKEPSKHDKDQYEKYMKQTRQSEQENLKRIEDKKKENSNNYGISEEEINKARQEKNHSYEHSR